MSPSAVCSTWGTRSRHLAGTRDSQRSRGSDRWPSAEINRYSRPIVTSPTSRRLQWLQSYTRATSTDRGGTMPLATEPSTFVISITPFDKKERFDEEGLRGHFRRLAASGIGVYVAGGGSGEAYTLSKSETKRVLEIVVEVLKGKVRERGI